MPRKLNPERVREYLWGLRHSDRAPAASYGDLADKFEVSYQTVANNAEAISNQPGIKTGEVAGSECFWYSHRDNIEEDGDPVQDVEAEEISEGFRRKISSARARWLDARSFATALDTDWSSPQARLRLYSELRRYQTGPFPATYPETKFLEDEDGGYVAGDLEESQAEKIRSAFEDVELLKKPWFSDYVDSLEPVESLSLDGVEGDTVTGLSEFLLLYVPAVREELVDDEGELRDLEDEELDRLLPSVAELVYIGDVYDKVVCESLNIRW